MRLVTPSMTGCASFIFGCGLYAIDPMNGRVLLRRALEVTDEIVLTHKESVFSFCRKIVERLGGRI